MHEQIPDNYLPIAKQELEEELCLCIGGNKNGACDDCEFRKAVVEKIESNEKQDSEE